MHHLQIGPITISIFFCCFCQMLVSLYHFFLADSLFISCASKSVKQCKHEAGSYDSWLRFSKDDILLAKSHDKHMFQHRTCLHAKRFHGKRIHSRFQTWELLTFSLEVDCLPACHSLFKRFFRVSFFSFSKTCLASHVAMSCCWLWFMWMQRSEWVIESWPVHSFPLDKNNR